jgi:hypothetical protein
MTAPIKTIRIIRQGPAGPPAASGGVFSAIASQAEAQAGMENTKGMTPLRTAEAIEAQAQPPSAMLSSIAALTFSAGSMLFATGAAAFNVAPTTAYGRGLLNAANAAGLNLTPADVGLGSVTNDTQTKAAVVPNTLPGAAQMLLGNAAGTAYAPVALSGAVTMTSAGVATLAADSTVSNSLAVGGALVSGTTATFYRSSGYAEVGVKTIDSTQWAEFRAYNDLSDHAVLAINGSTVTGSGFGKTPRGAFLSVDASATGGLAICVRATNGPMVFCQGGTDTAADERFRIDTSGNLALYTGYGLVTSSTGFIKAPRITPTADSTSAIQITKADGTTVVGTWDTTNQRFGIGITPADIMHLYRASAQSNLIIETADQTSTAGFNINAGSSSQTFQLVVNGSSTANTNLLNIPLSTRMQSASPLTGGWVFITRAGPTMWATGGAATTNERMRLTSTGGLSLGSNTFNATDPGAGSLSVQGNLNLPGLPTSDPHVAGRVWSNSGVMSVSAG